VGLHEFPEAQVHIPPGASGTWAVFWEALEPGSRAERRAQAKLLSSALARDELDDRSIVGLVDSLASRRGPVEMPRAANIVGTGGGPRTFNVSTAAALVAATLGVPVVKSGSRAFTSRFGSVDLIELLGIPLARSHGAVADSLQRFGIAFAGAFVYPPELKLLMSSAAIDDRHRLEGFFNRIGPFLTALPSSCQLTGVSDRGAMPLLERLAVRRRPCRVWLCFNRAGFDELVAFEENVVRPNDAPEFRLRPGSPAWPEGSREDLRAPEGRDEHLRQFTGVLAGDGAKGAVATIALNAAALLVASDAGASWDEAYRCATRSLEEGHAAALLRRLRRAAVDGTTADSRDRRGARLVNVSTRASSVEIPRHAALGAAVPARPALVLFLNAGDPPFAVLRSTMLMLEREGVDWVELAVPFPGSVTDGPVIRRSAARALRLGVGLQSTLSFLTALNGELSRLRVALMADWRHTVRPVGLERFLGLVGRSGCAGVLLHGVPPRTRPAYYERARELQVPVVATCYVSSSQAVLEEAAENASAYLYLVSRYGRSGGPPQALDRSKLAAVIGRLRPYTSAPIAVGFGVRTAEDIRAVASAGGDAAIVGDACVDCVERALRTGADPGKALGALLSALGYGEAAKSGAPVGARHAREL
jgi:tryptophan synthase alpha subunit